MFTKFTKITNGLSSLGDAIDNDQKVRKVIRALPPSWEVKATTLKELNDKKEMELIGLIGLRTYDMERMAREKMAPQKKKMIAFKFTPSDGDDEEEDDEELFLLVKYVRRMYNKATFNNSRRWQGKKTRKSFALIAVSRDTLLHIAPRIKASHIHQRNPTSRKLSKQHGIRKVHLMKR